MRRLPDLGVIHEDADLLVLHKPAGLVCHPTKGDAYSSLVSWVRLMRPGGSVHLVNRLDRETSGVTIAAKNPEAARDLGRLFESRAVTKCYWAVVHGWVGWDRLRIEAPLGRDESSPVVIQDGVRPDGVAATSCCTVVGRLEGAGRPFSLVRVEPLTGRKHQIRIHLAHVGHPIVGDKIYGGDPGRYLRFVAGGLTEADRVALVTEHHALHAASLAFEWRGVPRCFASPPEPWFLALAGGAWPERAAELPGERGGGTGQGAEGRGKVRG